MKALKVAGFIVMPIAVFILDGFVKANHLTNGAELIVGIFLIVSSFLLVGLS